MRKKLALYNCAYHIAKTKIEVERVCMYVHSRAAAEQAKNAMMGPENPFFIIIRSDPPHWWGERDLRGNYRTSAIEEFHG